MNIAESKSTTTSGENSNKMQSPSEYQNCAYILVSMTESSSDSRPPPSPPRQLSSSGESTPGHQFTSPPFPPRQIPISPKIDQPFLPPPPPSPKSYLLSTLSNNLAHPKTPLPNINIQSVESKSSPDVSTSDQIISTADSSLSTLSIAPSSATYNCGCLLCVRGCPVLVIRSPTWSTIMRVVFFTLSKAFPNQQYFNLRSDVYNWMDKHWDYLCKPSNKDRENNWRKQVQDMLSHSKNLFESGSEHFHQNGYWRLKPTIDIDPWTIKKAPRDKTKIPLKKRSFSENDLGRHLKRKAIDDVVEDGDENYDYTQSIRYYLLQNDEDIKREFNFLREELNRAKQKVVSLSQRRVSSSPIPNLITPVGEQDNSDDKPRVQRKIPPPPNIKQLSSPSLSNFLHSSTSVKSTQLSMNEFHLSTPPRICPSPPSSSSTTSTTNTNVIIPSSPPSSPSSSSPPPQLSTKSTSHQHLVPPLMYIDLKPKNHSNTNTHRQMMTQSLPSILSCFPSPNQLVNSSSTSPSLQFSSTSQQPLPHPPSPNGHMINHYHYQQQQLYLQHLQLYQQQAQKLQQLHQHYHPSSYGGMAIPPSSTTPTPTNTPLLTPNRMDIKSQLSHIMDIDH